MSLTYLNTIIPLKRMLVLCAVFVVIIETVVVSFVAITGYVTVNSVVEFVIRLIYSYSLSFVACVLIAYIDLYFIGILNRKITWAKKAGLRICVQFIVVIFIGVVVAIAITLIAEMLNSYGEPLGRVIVNNIMIVAVGNILITAVLELWIALFEKNRAIRDQDKLALEVSDLKYLVLKSQIDPHFLFNSLNVLSGLVSIDPIKAQEFIDELAYVYRYVLETIDSKIVKLSQEIDFIKSYLALIKIRYGTRIDFEIDVLDVDALIPPMTLQFAIENAIKHNLASDKMPLHLNLSIKDEYVVVCNNIQQKHSTLYSSGIGQKNINNRYKIVSDKLPIYYEENSFYYSKFPIIRTWIDESNNY